VQRQGSEELRLQLTTFLTAIPARDTTRQVITMNINEAFPSRYLAAADLGGRTVAVVINNVALEELGKGSDKDRKLVLTFAGKQKQFVCNKTNAKVIAGLYGPDTDGWIGQSIAITPREVEFQGDMVLAIRVSLQRPAEMQARQGQAPAPAPKPAMAAIAEDDGDVPF
jgi:hypothetical protein